MKRSMLKETFNNIWESHRQLVAELVQDEKEVRFDHLKYYFQQDQNGLAYHSGPVLPNSAGAVTRNDECCGR